MTGAHKNGRIKADQIFYQPPRRGHQIARHRKTCTNSLKSA
jgi:hypothetical protein